MLRNILYPIFLLSALVWFGGCASVSPRASTTVLLLSPDQKVMVGAAVEDKLIQLLGGRYHDKLLAEDLNRLSRQRAQDTPACTITIADRSSLALYPLPGNRAIVTRGLLSEVSSRGELESLLLYAGQLSGKIFTDRVSLPMAEATEGVLSAATDSYDPDSAGIRLARQFEQSPCEKSCLAPFRQAAAAAHPVKVQELPESLKGLAAKRSGYTLLASAQELEKDDNQLQAIATYLQAAVTAPDEPRILGSLGLAYLRAGQLQPARLHLQKAVRLQPGYYRTWMGLGYLYLQQGKVSQANEALATSVRLLPVTENLFLLAEAREKSGDAASARSLYQRVVETDRSSKLGLLATDRLAESAVAQ